MTPRQRPEPGTAERAGMRESVARFDERRRRWRAEGGRTLAVVAAVAGVGWSIVIPALVGFAVGHWLDARLATGVVLSGGLGFLGVALGCAAAWRRISARLERETRPRDGDG